MLEGLSKREWESEEESGEKGNRKQGRVEQKFDSALIIPNKIGCSILISEAQFKQGSSPAEWEYSKGTQEVQ